MYVNINEILTFKRLLSYSSNRRKGRADDVKYKTPPNFASGEDTDQYIFSTKSNPSTTGKTFDTSIVFFKPRNPKLPLERCKCKVDCNCFGPDTKVLMSTGVYKPIKDIRIGEYVYTHTGNIKMVTNNRSFPITDVNGVYEMSVTNFYGKFIVTGDHPFYVLRGNEKCLCGCGEIINSFRNNPHQTLNVRFKRGHYKKKQVISNQKDLSGGVFKWETVSNFKRGEHFLSPYLVEGSLDLDLDLCRLLGYYLSEGFCCRVGHETRFSLHKNEENTLAKDIKRICDKLNIENWFVFYKKTNTMEVRISSIELKKWFLKNGGRGSYNKIMSPDIMSLNNKCLTQIALGMILGDGCFNRSHDSSNGSHKDIVRWASCSESLTGQLSTIFNKLHISHNISKTESVRFTHGYIFNINISPGESSRVIFDIAKHITPKADREITIPKSYGLVRPEGNIHQLKSLERIEYTGDVYDLTVEGDESFIVHGVAVHNCPDYKYTYAYANKKTGSSDIGMNSLNKCINKPPRITNPRQRTGMCKHLIALNDYVEGELYSMPAEMDTKSKLDTLSSKYKKPLKPLPGAERRKAEMDKIRGIKESVIKYKDFFNYLKQ